MMKEDLKYLIITANRLTNEFHLMFGKTGIRRDCKRINITKNYKEQKLESHVRPRPEGIRHIQEVMLKTESKWQVSRVSISV